MQVNKSQLLKFLKYCFLGSVFGCIAFACLKYVYYAITPELAIVTNFFESENIQIYLKHQINSMNQLVNFISYCALALVIAFIGTVSGVFSKALLSKAEPSLREE